ncbi:hypothetical protein EJ357_02380 [Streptomyces cyaneochromogenes]|uniref:Beta-defensin-like domain-containing protein n=1 Tax=Streptomyces cyaneochromogenes TaxID=2496836 RepID=A0A3Q9F073_9ACTN|nr:hypothetical protein EJ357_02380 [Streptomyces cyaneochromogenes]
MTRCRTRSTWAGHCSPRWATCCTARCSA